MPTRRTFKTKMIVPPSLRDVLRLLAESAESSATSSPQSTAAELESIDKRSELREGKRTESAESHQGQDASKETNEAKPDRADGGTERAPDDVMKRQDQDGLPADEHLRAEEREKRQAATDSIPDHAVLPDPESGRSDAGASKLDPSVQVDARQEVTASDVSIADEATNSRQLGAGSVPDANGGADALVAHHHEEATRSVQSRAETVGWLHRSMKATSIYVDDAGLVLLHPFLRRHFEQLHWWR